MLLQLAAEMMSETTAMPSIIGVAPGCPLPDSMGLSYLPLLSLLPKEGYRVVPLKLITRKIELDPSTVSKEVPPPSMILHRMCSGHILKNISWPSGAQKETVL